VRADIFAAAGRLLTEGMGSFTIERIAALARASKMTIYKGGPPKAHPGLEAYAAITDSHYRQRAGPCRTPATSSGT
jgi:hypothetical protein